MRKKFKINYLVALLLTLALPYANITRLIGLEDSFSVFVIILIILISIKQILNNQKIVLNYFTLILLLSSVGMIYSYINNEIPRNDFISQSIKTLFFVLLGSTAIDYKYFTIFISKYHKIFLISLIASILIYIVFPLEEFVFYDGSERRFGGLHFELYNFLYSTVLFYVSWIFSKKNKKYGFIFLLAFAFISKSNIVLLYGLIYLLSFYFSNIFNKKSIFYVSVFMIIMFPIIIGYFLNYLEFLNIFSVRNSSSFDHNGSSLFIRLYPFSLATEYLLSQNIFLNFLPTGLGFFENTQLVKNDEFSFGGTGSPKALIELGVLLFIVLIFIISKKGYNYYIKSKHLNKNLYLFLFFSTLVFISFGAGFFNLVAWYIIMNLTTKNKT